MVRKMVWMAACVAFLAANAALAGEVDLKAAAKAAADKGAPAVVSLKVTTDMVYNMGGKEQRHPMVRTMFATVLDNTGLIVAAADTVDPYAQYRQAADAKAEEAADKQAARAAAYPKPVLALMMPDGTEAPLVVVRETPGLMFFRPEKQQKLPCLAVPDKVSELGVPDEMLLVSTLETEGGNEARVSVAHVEAVIRKPSLMYVVSPSTLAFAYSGTTPVFDAKGELVGVLTLAALAGQEDRAARRRVGMPSMSVSARAPVVIPITDVMKASVPAE